MKLWLIGLGVVLVIAVAVAGVKWNEHREQQKRDATVYCAMDPDAGDAYSPEFKNCVEQYLD